MEIAKVINHVWLNFIMIFGAHIAGWIIGDISDDEGTESDMSLLAWLISIGLAVQNVFKLKQLYHSMDGSDVMKQEIGSLYDMCRYSVYSFGLLILTAIFMVVFRNYEFPPDWSKGAAIIIFLILTVGLQVMAFIKVHSLRKMLKDSIEERGMSWKQTIKGGQNVSNGSNQQTGSAQ